MFYTLIAWLLSLLLVLLAVAFFTLFERNVIGLVHLRVGPNNVFFIGLLQPLLDAFKLLSKSHPLPAFSNLGPYYVSPFLSLGISLVLWLVVPSVYSSLTISFSLLAFIFITSLLVFPLLLSGWSSNSNYSLIGSLRSIAQSISYEAVLSTIVISVFLLFMTYSILSVASYKPIFLILLLPIWVFCTLAECHRAPFDFSESESELVSGFNTEYIGSFFAFVFLAEYSALLVSSAIISYLFIGFLVNGVLTFSLSVLLVSFSFIVVRVTFCRFRYDLLMISAWNSYLPVSLLLLVGLVFLV